MQPTVPEKLRMPNAKHECRDNDTSQDRRIDIHNASRPPKNSSSQSINEMIVRWSNAALQFETIFSFNFIWVCLKIDSDRSASFSSLALRFRGCFAWLFIYFIGFGWVERLLLPLPLSSQSFCRFHSDGSILPGFLIIITCAFSVVYFVRPHRCSDIAEVISYMSECFYESRAPYNLGASRYFDWSNRRTWRMRLSIWFVFSSNNQFNHLQHSTAPLCLLLLRHRLTDCTN